MTRHYPDGLIELYNRGCEETHRVIARRDDPLTADPPSVTPTSPPGLAVLGLARSSVIPTGRDAPAQADDPGGRSGRRTDTANTNRKGRRVSAAERRAFAAEIAGLAGKHKGFGSVQTTTKSGHTVALTGVWGEEVSAIVITAPDGHEVRRADGWKIGKTAEVAEFLWDVMEQEKARAAKRERLAGLKAVRITSADAVGWAASKESTRYHLTPEQLAQLLTLAEQFASTNAAVTA